MSGDELAGLREIVDCIRRLRPVTADPETIALARLVARSCGSDDNEDLDTWAEWLAERILG